LKEGVLTLRSGEDFFADLQVTLFLFLENDTVVPEGRVWQVACDGGWQAGVPHVHVAWREHGERMPEHASTTCDFQLQLELGHETERETIPGRISLSAPGLGTQLVGTFEAAIEGFRLKDGKVDLSKDDLDVTHHVAAVWLAEKNGGPIEVEDHALAWLHTEKPEGRAQVGYSVYWWRPQAGAELRVAKLQFEKRDNAWAVSRSLPLWQVAAAHPLSPRGDLSFSLEQRAAVRFESEHRETHGDVPVFVAEVRSRYNPKAGLGEVTVRYVLDDAEARDLSRLLADREAMPTTRYLFRTDADYPRYKEPEAWRLERRLSEGEGVDFKVGQVVAAGATAR
jgi:hypothetical protein